MKKKTYSLVEARQRIINYCVKNDRCKLQVLNKLTSFGLSVNSLDELLLELIEEEYLDEQRFSSSFCRGKFYINKWGKRKIIAELKKKNISDEDISSGLKEIEDSDYFNMIQILVDKKSNILSGTNKFMKQKKILNYMHQKGYEYDLVLAYMNKL